MLLCVLCVKDFAQRLQRSIQSLYNHIMLKLIAVLIEAFDWVRIVASPLIVALILGGVLYLSNPGTVTLFCAILIALLGLVVGVLWATRVWRKSGTTEFLSRVDATPELNKPENKQE